MSSGKSQDTALERLLKEPKGKVSYSPNQAFLLHVFWECPDIGAARRLLQALQKCAAATHRDTPCVPVYFFRISTICADVRTQRPRTIQEHPVLQAAIRKLQVGVPRQAVLADLARRNIDSNLIDLDPSTTLPKHLQNYPATVECTELYLDERAFQEHAGSRDYLAAYADVINPALRTRHHTVRVGNPTEYLVERVLEPMLQEVVTPLFEGTVLWRAPTVRGTEVMLSLDLSTEEHDLQELLSSSVGKFDRYAVVVVIFTHPLRDHIARLLVVLSNLMRSTMDEIHALPVQRGELHCSDSSVEEVKRTVDDGNHSHLLAVNADDRAGYILHARSGELVRM